MALISGGGFHGYITKRQQKEKNVCACVHVCVLLDFKLLLLLEQNLFCPWVMFFFCFVLFLSFWFQDREASVNMVLRGECLVKLTHREVLGREVGIDPEAMDLHANSLERYQLVF